MRFALASVRHVIEMYNSLHALAVTRATPCTSPTVISVSSFAGEHLDEHRDGRARARIAFAIAGYSKTYPGMGFAKQMTNAVTEPYSTMRWSCACTRPRPKTATRTASPSQCLDRATPRFVRQGPEQRGRHDVGVALRELQSPDGEVLFLPAHALEVRAKLGA